MRPSQAAPGLLQSLVGDQLRGSSFPWSSHSLAWAPRPPRGVGVPLRRVDLSPAAPPLARIAAMELACSPAGPPGAGDSLVRRRCGSAGAAPALGLHASRRQWRRWAVPVGSNARAALPDERRRVDPCSADAAGPDGGALSRRAVLALPALVASAALLAPNARGQEEGRFALYEDKAKGFSLVVPATWEQREKAGATALFEDPSRRSASVGVVVNPVRIESLRDFGSLEFVAEKLLDAERRKESTKSVEILSQTERERLPGPTLYYEFEYALESTRGNKRLLTSVAVARRQLFILNITLPDAKTEEDAARQAALLQDLRQVQKSFQVL